MGWYVMNQTIRSYWVILSLLLLTSVVGAKVDTVNLGPFNVEYDTNGLGDDVRADINTPAQFDNYNEYWVRIDDYSAKGNYIDVYIDDYGTTPVDVSESRLRNDIATHWGNVAKVDWQLTDSIGGRPAVIAKVTYNDGSGVSYDSLYSPDGVGNRGSIIANVFSTYPESATNTFLSKIKIKRA